MDDRKLSRPGSVISGSSIAQVYGLNDENYEDRYKSAKAKISDDSSRRAKRLSYSILISLFIIFL